MGNNKQTNYNSKIHHRRSIRLRGYDYSRTGAYFITICTQNRSCLFGCVDDGSMIPNDAGKMVERWYCELKNKFPDIQCVEHVVMPNHVHFIIQNVGADLCVCPVARNGGEPIERGEHTKQGEHTGSPLRQVVQWFKTMSTNEYIRFVKTDRWPLFDGRLWQRNYYEHIIRNDDELNRVREYILNNPRNWQTDENNPNASKPESWFPVGKPWDMRDRRKVNESHNRKSL